MADRRSQGRAALAAEAWRRLFHFFISTRAQRDEVLARHRLTPNDIRALGSLAAAQGRTMRSLAEEWGCDASNATWIVDRLVKRRLARRSTPASDRRVKHVLLTPRGEQARRRVFRDLDRPPRELLTLEPGRLQAIRDAFERLPGADPSVRWPDAPSARTAARAEREGRVRKRRARATAYPRSASRSGA